MFCHNQAMLKDIAITTCHVMIGVGTANVNVGFAVTHNAATPPSGIASASHSFDQSAFAFWRPSSPTLMSVFGPFPTTQDTIAMARASRLLDTGEMRRGAVKRFAADRTDSIVLTSQMLFGFTAKAAQFGRAIMRATGFGNTHFARLALKWLATVVAHICLASHRRRSLPYSHSIIA